MVTQNATRAVSGPAFNPAQAREWNGERRLVAQVVSVEVKRTIFLKFTPRVTAPCLAEPPPSRPLPELQPGGL